MKTNLHSSLVTRPVAIALLATFTLFTLTPRAPAQTNISAADFQRLVYSANLHAELMLKPELEASLKVLLEMQRRNPNADPAALVNVLTNALQIYRTKEPFYVRTNGYPDEVLAAYLDALRQVPAHTNFISADLTLLNVFMLGAADDNCLGNLTNYTQLDLVNSAEQQLFSASDEVLKRQALVNDCMDRAQRDGLFASAMDNLLYPQTGAFLAEPPAEIISDTNSPLYDDVTMTNLLGSQSTNGSVSVSSDLLATLFAEEMSNVWATAQTNLDMQAQMNQTEPDWTAYLTNQAAMDRDAQHIAAVQQNQPAKLASAIPAVMAQAQLEPVNTDSAETEQIVSGVGDVVIGIGSLCKDDPCGAEGIFSGGLDLFNSLTGMQSPQDAMAAQIQNIQNEITNLSANMNYRFDRVDQSLTTMFNTMNDQFDQITIGQEQAGRTEVTILGDVNQIRGAIFNLQTELDLLSTVVIEDLSFADNQDLMNDINSDLLYQTLHPGNGPISYAKYQGDSDLFKTYATADASGPLNSPSYPTSLSLAAELSVCNLNFNLNYIKGYLDGPLGQNTGGNLFALANPDEWFTAAYASLQLAGENPMYFRKYTASDLGPIIARGQNDADFCASLTFYPTGTTNINWSLWNALENYYQAELNDFTSQVATTESEFATNNSFDVSTWRQWDIAAPRVTATNSAVVVAAPRSLIAAGVSHSLVVKPDGTVAAWGDNSDGQCSLPAGLTNVTEVAAGGIQSLALKSDGTVAAWGAGGFANPGYALLFNGVNNYVEFLFPPSMGDDFTIEFWFQSTQVAGGTTQWWQGMGLVDGDVPNVENDFGISLGQGRVLFGTGGSSDYTIASPNVVADGQWHFVAATRQMSTGAMQLYVDGQLVASGTHSANVSLTAPTLLNLGKTASCTCNFFQGTLDEVRIWSAVHSQAQIQAEMNVALTGSEPNLLVYYPLNEGSGSDAVNHASYQGSYYFTGALINQPAWVNSDEPEFVQVSVPAGLTNVVAVAAGVVHSLALQADGTVVGFGDNDMYGEATGVQYGAPGPVMIGGQPLTNVVAIAAGGWHSLALEANGTVVAWGDMSAVPAGLSNVVAVAAGYLFNLALKADGTYVGWGNNTYGECGNPLGLTNVAALAAAYDSGMALKPDGTVAVWGDNSYGQENIPAGLTNVAEIATSYGHCLALESDGTVVGWGYNDSGQASVPINFSFPFLTAYPHLAAGEDHCWALKADGHVVGWGGNRYGGETNLASSTNVTAVSAAGYHIMTLKADGTVVEWGDNYYGEVNVPANLNNVVAVATGHDHSLALTADGTVTGWGCQTNGQATGMNWSVNGQEFLPNAVPGVVPFLSGAVAIAAGYSHSLALLADGTVVGWGADNYGQVGAPEIEEDNSQFTEGLVPGLSNVVAIAAGGWHSLALQANGTVVAWGDNDEGQVSNINGRTNVVAIAAGDQHSLALMADGTVWGCGYDNDGQRSIPAGLSNVVAIAAGGDFSAALKADGSVVAWGDNTYGETNVSPSALDLDAWGEYPPGLETAPPVSSPVTAVASGSSHCLALTASGAVVGWGLNTWGQASVPPQAQSGVQAVSAGLGHSLALTANGCVLAWGLNDCGQASVPPSATNGAVAISAGGKHNLALRPDGTVVAWGLDGCGQTNVPGNVGTSVVQGQVVAVAAGGEHSLALLGNGSVVGWGDNDDGQATGDPSGSAPWSVSVGGQPLSGVVAIAAGRYHSLALTSAGQVKAWGLNTSGQCNVPAAAQSDVVAIAAGKTHSLALRADGSAVVWGSGPVTVLPPQAGNNVVAIAAGDEDTLLLRANTSSGTSSTQPVTFVQAQIPYSVPVSIENCNQNTINELGQAGTLSQDASDFAGAKELLAAVLQLGMPYTLAHDGILHSCLYGSEPLMDTGAVTNFLIAQNALLQATPNAPPRMLGDEAALRFQGFTNRLNQCLNNLQAIGQPEIPRLLDHTLRLLNLCADACTATNKTPPPALEVMSVSKQPSVLLYGEPYVDYTLQSCGSLNSPNWINTTITCQDGQTNAMSGGPMQFYRAVTDLPSMPPQ